MMCRILQKLASVFTVTLVVVFCTYGLWDNVQKVWFPSGNDDSSETFGETTGVPPTQVTLPPETEATAPVTKPPESEPTEPQSPFTTAPEGYFADALFIGDSRTVGLWEYGDLEDATFFASTGMSVYSVYYEQVSNKSLETLLSSRSFKKIYVMLGINELGYDMNQTVREYRALIQWIRGLQPDAVIYIEANLHVSASRSETDAVYNNENIDLFNARIAALADEKQVFYLDINCQFDDAQGNLADKYTADDTHVLAKYYKQWSNWIKENAVVI